LTGASVKRLVIRAVLALATAAALSGCATRWVVDNDVDTFSKIAAMPAEPSYRFERLPSQQVDEAAQQQLEAMATPALERAGLRLGGTAARYTVQINARVSAELSPWADPWMFGGPWGGGWNAGVGLGWRYRGYGAYGYGTPFPQPSNPWYAREVSVVMRELPGGQIVYESHARNDGPYNISTRIFPVMFEAAMQGFPNPPTGTRRINIELGAATAPAKP
jgi:hypothetical protein